MTRSTSAGCSIGAAAALVLRLLEQALRLQATVHHRRARSRGILFTNHQAWVRLSEVQALLGLEVQCYLQGLLREPVGVDILGGLEHLRRAGAPRGHPFEQAEHGHAMIA